MRVGRQHRRGARLARTPDPRAGEGMAAGDVVNTAARLQAAAPVNGILVGEATLRATDACDRVPARPSRWRRRASASRCRPGRRSTPASRVRRRRAPARRARRSSGASASSTCSSARSSARGAERAPQLVTLVGVPGIGKSRLVCELFQVVDARPGARRAGARAAACPTARASPSGRSARSSRRTPASSRRDSRRGGGGKLARAVAASSGRGEARLGGDAPAPARRPRAPSEPRRAGAGGVRRLAPLPRGARRAAARSCSSSRTSTGPTTALLDFVDHLVDWASGVPLLVVCTARPELLERRPGWGGGKPNATTLALSPARGRGHRDAARRALLERAVLPAETQRRCSRARAGIRSTPRSSLRLLSRTARRQPSGAAGDGPGDRRRPARRAPPEEKALLQDAAVLGQGLLARARSRRSARATVATSSAPARAGAQGVRAPRAALVGRGRDGVRVPARARSRRRVRADPPRRARRQAPGARPSGSSRSAARTTTRSSSRTTT